MPERKLLFFCLLFFFLLESLRPPCLLAENTAFEFPSFSLRNFTLLGDSYLRDGVIGLTRDINVPSSSSGTIIYNNPIAFSDPQSRKTASFSTRFSFSIENINAAASGDGLAFFLSPRNQILGSPGGYLGLVNSSQLTKNNFVAVEFDTKLDLIFDDPDDNHVGLDIESLISIKTSNLTLRNIDLKSGELITAWIDYKNDETKLNVFLSYTSLKPEAPLLTVDFNLSGYVKEFMFVGFSASTQGSTELHLIKNWSFRTSGLFLGREKRLPHNVSDSSVIRPPISIQGSPSKHHKRFGLGFGIAAPAFFCAFLVVLGWISVKKWREIHSESNLKGDFVTGPRKFSYRQLKLATRGFHPSRILGHGAYGTVYRADFKDSDSVFAVKRSKHTSDNRTEFTAELSIIACLRHKNLVQLQGWCVEQGELLLVYEFMPNGSLDSVLYQDSKNGAVVLKWDYRYNIATGLASVLTYLHQECEQQVIHRDIKTSNIMLDGNFNARLGDFGLARLMDHDKSPVSTLTVGTMGYLAPEYLQYGKATEKTDVFSYGVVILELACGRRPIGREDYSDKGTNLVDWVWALHSQGNIVGAADPRLDGKFNDKEMKKLLLVGLSCANPDSQARPSMRRVFQILGDDGETVSVPRMKPSLSFSCGLSVKDLVSDDEEECFTSEHRIEINAF